MKIRLHSDLHLEFQDQEPPAARANVVVPAGDGLEWARRHFPATPVVDVPRNHEFYDSRLQDVLAACARPDPAMNPAN